MTSLDASHEALSESQLAVLEVFRAVFRHEATLDRARAAEPLGFDAALWEHLRAVGATGLGLRAGGGVGLAELVVMAETVGRSIAAAPIIEHVVASRLIERVVGHVDADLSEGSAIAALALHPTVDAAWRLVPAGAVATVVVGVHDEQLMLMRSPAPMAAPRNHASAPLAHRAIGDATSCTAIGTAAHIASAITEWRLLTAAALVGIAHTALELAVDYARTRTQFGVPIGSFQAIQHGLADLPGMIDGARLLVHEAAWALDAATDTAVADGNGGPEAGHARPGAIDLADDRIDDGPTLARMAFLFSADVASTATHRSLHVHGGYGFAEEYDIQLLHRRARGWALAGGDLGSQFQHLANRLLGAPTSPDDVVVDEAGSTP